MDSASERTRVSAAMITRPVTRIDGPDPKWDGLSQGVAIGSRVALISLGGKCGPTVTQNGQQERDNPPGALRGD
jgi:hypothetical protein